MHGLRYCVFIYGAPDVNGRSLGFVSTEAMRWDLARRYPHLERAHIDAFCGLTDAPITSGTGALDPQMATSFINGYLAGIQARLLLSTADLDRDVKGFAKNLLEAPGLSGYLRSQLSESARRELATGPQWFGQLGAVVASLNVVIEEQSIYEEARFSGIQLSEKTKRMLSLNPEADDRTLLTRCLFHDAYPAFVAPVAPVALPPDQIPPHKLRFISNDWIRLRSRDDLGFRSTWERARWLDRAAVEALFGSGARASSNGGSSGSVSQGAGIVDTASRGENGCYRW